MNLVRIVATLALAAIVVSSVAARADFAPGYEASMQFDVIETGL